MTQIFTRGKATRTFEELEHGKPSTYNHWSCRCDACTAAYSQAAMARQRKRAALPFDQKPHGTPNGYQNYCCRCDECGAAWKAYVAGGPRTRRTAVTG